jgi:peptide chain release factor 1
VWTGGLCGPPVVVPLAFRLDEVIAQLVEQIEARFAEAEREMSDGDVISDRVRYAEAGRRYRQLAPAAELARQWRHATSDAEGAQEMLDEGGEDPEMREELRSARARIERLEEELRLAMVERDPNDDKSVIVEIRAGAGGDEAGLWAGDVYRMLNRYAERLGFQTETMDARTAPTRSKSAGTGAYSVFKFEGGTHRVPARARDGIPGPHPHVRPPRSPSCPKPRTSTSTSTRTTSRSTSTAPPAPAGSP